MQTFFKIIGALSVLAGFVYLIYRLYDRKCSSEFLFKKCNCCDDDDDCQCAYEICDCEDDTIYFDDADYDTGFASEKICADDFMTEEEIKNQDNNNENEEF